MDFKGVKNLYIKCVDCIADVTRGNDDELHFVSTKEKYFDIKLSKSGKLSIRQKDYNIFSRRLIRKTEFKLALPKDFDGDIKFRNKNGGMFLVGDGKFNRVKLSTKNGSFNIKSIKCDKLKIKLRNGSITLKDAVTNRKQKIKCGNGNAKIETAVAQQIKVRCKCSDISLVDAKTSKLKLRTKNGNIDTSGITADEQKIITKNGKISVAPLGSRDEHRLSLDTRRGTINLDGTLTKPVYDFRGEKRLTVKTSNGDVDIRFLH